jgi:hypothetical protein
MTLIFFVFDNTSKKSLIFCQSVEISVNPCPIFKMKKNVTFLPPVRLIIKVFGNSRPTAEFGIRFCSTLAGIMQAPDLIVNQKG